MANNFLTVQFLHLYISVRFDVSVNCTALYGLMTNNIAIDRTVSENMSENLHLKILRSIIAIARKRDLYRRFIR